MALGALLRPVMVNLGRMAGEAESAAGGQCGNCRRLMAFGAAGVSVHRSLVGLDDLFGLMTGCTVLICGVVLGMAGDARSGPRLGLETDGSGMTLDAPHLRVFRMLERRLSGAWRLLRDRHVQRDIQRGQLAFGVAGCTIVSRRTLMMAYLAAPRRGEGERALG